MNNIKVRQMIKSWIAILVLIIIIVIVIVAMLKYEAEGETDMPYILSKISIISSAEGIPIQQEQEQANRWNLNLVQNNDIYFSIEKNDKYPKEEILKLVSIENIRITKVPQRGNIRIYMPSSSEGRLYQYEDEYLVIDHLQYKGALKSNPKTLEIGNQGGTALIRFSNTNIGEYISNEDAEIKHDGTLLTKVEATKEQITFDVSFDIIIEVNNKKYKASTSLTLPCGNILEEGISTLEKTDLDLIFKRI